MSTFKSSRFAQISSLTVVLLGTLIGCQQPLAPTGQNPDYVITGPGTPPAVDTALQNQPPVATLAPNQTNLLLNPDLENFTNNNPDHWVPCAPNTLQPSNDAANGLKAVLIAQNKSCLYQSARITPGQNLNLTCQAKLVQNLGWTGWGLSFYDANFQKIGSAPTRRITSTTYEQYDTNATAPTNAAYATVWAYSEGQMLLDQCNLSVSDPTNIGDLLVNGGFEGNLTNWSLCNDASLVSISSQAQSGTRALRLAANGCAYQDTELKPNHEYDLSCQAKVTGNRYTELSLVYMDANWKPIVRKGVQVTGSTYSSMSVRLVTPAGMVRSAVAMYSQSDEAFFDACTLKDTGLVITTDPKSTLGSWSDILPLPLVPVSAAGLPNGSILFWAGNTGTSFGAGGTTSSIVFNPYSLTASAKQVSETRHEMFCPGTAMLANGELLVNGGSNAEATSIYDSVQNVWRKGQNMNLPRGYNASVTLENGNVFTLGGSWSGVQGGKNGEVWNNNSGWTNLPGASAVPLYGYEPVYRSDNHSWLFANGNRVLYAGPGNKMNWYDTTGNGGISSAGNRGDDQYAQNGNAVMFDRNKILTLGGATSYDQGVQASNRSYVIDLSAGSSVNPSVRKVGNLNFARGMHSSVVLPDGQVITIGGMPKPVPFSDANAVLTPEIWNPQSEQWRTLAAMKVPRTYHSVSILMPDARVISAGGGLCGGCSVNHTDAEIFTPPYLYNIDGGLADRPEITVGNDTITYGRNFEAQISGEIRKINLIRLGSITHTVNNDQRLIPLGFSRSGSTYSINAPENSSVATPGYYMLFALNATGVPSRAQIMKVQ
jgi:Domain of unknown function (DUF1929)/Carbohydrate binding domain